MRNRVGAGRMKTVCRVRRCYYVVGGSLGNRRYGTFPDDKSRNSSVPKTNNTDDTPK